MTPPPSPRIPEDDIRDFMVKHNLTAFTHIVLLLAVCEASSITRTELAKRCRLTTGAITPMIDALVAKGLVALAPCESDRRKELILPTQPTLRFCKNYYDSQALYHSQRQIA